jgi:diacylglycerol O-acyltransferase
VRALWQGVPRASHSRDRLEEELGDAGRAIGATLRKSLATASGIVSSTASLYRMLAGQGLRSLGLNDKAMALPFMRVPRVLSGKPSARRNYAFTTLPLGELKALGRSAGATVNDMLLAVLDGALDRYLADKPRRSRKPLVVDMPVALSGASGGNQIAVLQLAMGLPSMTLRERLEAIRAETSRVKAAVKSNPAETVMLYTTLVHSLPILLELVGISRPLLVSNLLFSNPFGFEKRCYLMGAEVELALPMSVVAAGQMLNVTVVTLADQLQIGFLGIPGAVDRIERLAECTREAFEELRLEFAAAEPPAPDTEPGPRAAGTTAKRTPANHGAKGEAPKLAVKRRRGANRAARSAAAA